MMENGVLILCPHCRTNSRYSVHEVFYRTAGDTAQLEETKVTKCLNCDGISIWKGGRVIHPLGASAPPPSEGFTDDIRRDYDEAARVVEISPRGAAALLRLALQKLCKELGAASDNINDAIAGLVSRGLPDEVQMAMDYVRVIGNNAVHPGVIDISDDKETAQVLFVLLNVVSDIMITQPRQVKSLYDSLPQNYRDQIANRRPRT